MGFSVTAKCRKMSVQLWERGPMLDLDLLHTDRDPIIVKNQLPMMAQFQGVVLLATKIISWGGSIVF